MLVVKNNSFVSMAIAFTILALWSISLIFCFQLDTAQLSWILVIAAMCLRTFLHTGIFIVTHDAIHGVVSHNHMINNLIGHVTAFLYALLPYQTLAKNHHQHHQYPATDNDPDFCVADAHNYFLWYAGFMKSYQQGKQFWILFWGMTVIFWCLISSGVEVANIFQFWVIPIILSSLQLFTFGIYFPHRPDAQGYRDRHRARSNNFSVSWSFITCYHFGYHWEHHQYPNLPWYKLPLVRH